MPSKSKKRKNIRHLRAPTKETDDNEDVGEIEEFQPSNRQAAMNAKTVSAVSRGKLNDSVEEESEIEVTTSLK